MKPLNWRTKWVVGAVVVLLVILESQLLLSVRQNPQTFAVFLGSLELCGFDFGPDDMNPYQQFVNLRPVEVIGGEILEYDGSFQIPEIAGVSHFGAANILMQLKQFDAAFQESQKAAQLNPKLLYPHEMLSALYAQRKQLDQALNEYQMAMHIYQTVHPDYQVYNDSPVNPVDKH